MNDLDPITPEAFRDRFVAIALERLGVTDASDAPVTAAEFSAAADNYAANPYWLDTGPEAAAEHYLPTVFSDLQIASAFGAAPSIDGPDPEGFEVPDPGALEAVFPALRAGAFAVASDLHDRLMEQGLTVRQAGSMAAHILLEAAYVSAAAGALAEGHDPKPERFAQAARAAAARYDITAIRTEFEADQKKENPDG